MFSNSKHFAPTSLASHTCLSLCPLSPSTPYAQMWILGWPKTTTKTCIDHTASGAAVAAAATTASITRNMVEHGRVPSYCCGCLTNLVKKIKKQGRLLRAATASRQSSFQCRYDPLSYSLNFDTSGCDDEDYYHFCAFSSRFVANPRSISSSTTTPMATSH